MFLLLCARFSWWREYAGVNAISVALKPAYAILAASAVRAENARVSQKPANKKLIWARGVLFLLRVVGSEHESPGLFTSASSHHRLGSLSRTTWESNECETVFSPPTKPNKFGWYVSRRANRALTSRETTGRNRLHYLMACVPRLPFYLSVWIRNKKGRGNLHWGPDLQHLMGPMGTWLLFGSSTKVPW